MGHGPLRRRLHEICLSLGLESHVRFSGYVDNPEDLLARSDIFVMPSRVLDDHQEHDAHAVLEALSAGVPTIGTNSGILPEILGDGTGLVVRAEAPAELAAVLVDLANDDSSRHVLALRGRNTAEKNFSLDVTAQKKAHIFRRVINGQQEQ